MPRNRRVELTPTRCVNGVRERREVQRPANVNAVANMNPVENNLPVVADREEQPSFTTAGASPSFSLEGRRVTAAGASRETVHDTANQIGARTAGRRRPADPEYAVDPSYFPSNGAKRRRLQLGAGPSVPTRRSDRLAPFTVTVFDEPDRANSDTLVTPYRHPSDRDTLVTVSASQTITQPSEEKKQAAVSQPSEKKKEVAVTQSSEEKKTQSSEEMAVKYLNKIKACFVSKDEHVYQKFLKILIKNREGTTTINEMYLEVASLFADHGDLLQEFVTCFLHNYPDVTNGGISHPNSN